MNINQNLQVYDSINNLPLRIFIEINNTGNVSLLGGEHPEETWEIILEEYSKKSKNKSFENTFRKLRQIKKLESKYYLVNAELTFLRYSIDENYINDLRQMGYYISRGDNYDKSIENSFQRARSILTRIEMLKRELGNEKHQPMNFESEIADIAIKFKFEPSYDITVAMWLEYKNRSVKISWN